MAGDTILHAWAGPEHNGLTVDWTDKVLIDGSDGKVTDCLKFTSHLQDFTGFFPNVRGGLEDCADLNNEVNNVRLKAASWQSGGKFCFTIKGGASNVTIEGPITNHGKEVDVDLGNWSDQSKKKTTGVYLNLTTPDHSPIIVRVLQADEPTFAPGSGPYKYAFPSPKNPLHGFFVWCFKTGLGLYKKFFEKKQ